MKSIAVAILTIIALRQAIRTMWFESSREYDKLAYILLPTSVMWLMVLGVL